MKHKLLNQVIILLSTVVFSCNNVSTDNYNPQQIDVCISCKEEPLSEFFEDSILVIKLETTKDNLISHLLKVQMIKDFIFILDSRGTLLKFHLNGRFIKSIRPIGKGIGEYLKPISFDISPNGSEIIINDFGQKKLVCFDLNLEYIKSKQLDFTTSRISIIDSSMLSCYTPYISNNNSCNLLLYDVDKQFIDKKGVLRSDGYKTTIADRFPFTRLPSNEILFHDSRFKTIYKVSKTKIYPMYMMNFESAELANEEIYTSNEKPSNVIYNSENFIWSYFFHPRKNNFFVSYVKNKKQYLFLKFANGETISSGDVYDDLGIDYTNDIYSYLNFVGTLDGKFIYSCSPSSDISSEKILYDQLKDVKKSDNPVLVILEIKSNEI